MSPKAFAFSGGSLVLHVKWPTQTAWSGLATFYWFWYFLCPGFLCSQHRAGLKSKFPVSWWSAHHSVPCIAPFECPRPVLFPWVSELFPWWWWLQDGWRSLRLAWGYDSSSFCMQDSWESGCHDGNVPDGMQVAWEGMWPCQDEVGKAPFALSELHVSLRAQIYWVFHPSLFALLIFSHLLACLQEHRGGIFPASHEGIHGHWLIAWHLWHLCS